MINRKNATKSFELLLDELVADMEATSDEDILAEVAAEPGGLEEAISRMDAFISQAIVDSGRKRQADVRLQAASHEVPTSAPQVVKIKPFLEKRRLFEKLVADQGIKNKLTMAARNGEAMTEEELDGLLDDLTRLGFDLTKGDGE